MVAHIKGESCIGRSTVVEFADAKAIWQSLGMSQAAFSPSRFHPLVFFGLSSFRRFVSRFPSSRSLPIASQVPSRFQNRGQQKSNRRSRRSRRGGIARAQAAAHFSRVRAITTGTADSVWAQRSRRSAFSICILCALAALRVILRPTASHEVDHTPSRQDAINSQTICVLVPSAWLRAAYPQ